MPGPGIESFVLLLGSEDPISGISQSRHNITVLIQMVILGADEDVHVRMFPSGAAMMHMKRILTQPLCLSMVMAAEADPPVASIGSRTKISLWAQSAGILQ